MDAPAWGLHLVLILRLEAEITCKTAKEISPVE
jgi:hypothetical protein